MAKNRNKMKDCRINGASISLMGWGLIRIFCRRCCCWEGARGLILWRVRRRIEKGRAELIHGNAEVTRPWYVEQVSYDCELHKLYIRKMINWKIWYLDYLTPSYRKFLIIFDVNVVVKGQRRLDFDVEEAKIAEASKRLSPKANSLITKSLSLPSHSPDIYRPVSYMMSASHSRCDRPLWCLVWDEHTSIASSIFRLRDLCVRRFSTVSSHWMRRTWLGSMTEEACLGMGEGYIQWLHAFATLPLCVEHHIFDVITLNIWFFASVAKPRLVSFAVVISHLTCDTYAAFNEKAGHWFFLLSFPFWSSFSGPNPKLFN